MVDPVAEWIEKAEEDYRVALALRRLRANPAHSSTCFHAQQCVEKYLKGYLVHCKAEIEKTHNLVKILNACIELNTEFSVLREEEIEILTPYATVYRYPDDFYMPIFEEAQSAINKAELVKEFVKNQIN